MRLDANWKIKDFAVGEARDLEVASPDYIDYFWMTAKVPGDVHSALIERGVIEDPFYGHNDQKCRWVEEKVWWYRTAFDFGEELQAGDRMELEFEGLDTFATVYLNGVELGSTDNMFISHTFEVTRELRKGKNTLAVKFDPVRLHVEEKVQYYWSGFSKKRIWTRKAQSHFGWDWGPRLVCAGIWKPVRLRKRSSSAIENVFARTASIADGRATVEIETVVRKPKGSADVEAVIRLSDSGGSTETRCVFADTKANAVLRIEQPNLWWTNDIGVPHLYDLSVRLYAGGALVDEYEQKFGIRTLEVRTVDDNGDPGFAFVLNGHKLFAKGANWIPIDSFVGAVPDARYKHLLEMAKDANMNMLRVWGGGIYERGVFYDECDRLGILVWQDFMFACALYPDYNRNFMDNVRREIRHVVNRLRSRTCLAIWCGNNENDWLHEALRSSDEIKDPFYGEKIYHELMPELMEELDPTRLFWPSSPYGGNDHNSRDEGDTHNWQVWHGNDEPRTFGEPQTQNYSVEGVSFKNYKKDNSLFVSEFGMHASANRYTLASYIPEQRFYWGSEELAYRNKDIHHRKGILLMEGYTGAPNDLDSYIDYSMLTQAEGLKYAIEHYRRNKARTSGTLFWQLNDCWPGTSWSVIDYFGLPKAGYHYVRKCYAPVLISLEYEPGEFLKFWVVNDLPRQYEDRIEWAVYDLDGNCRFAEAIDAAIPANRSVCVASRNAAEALAGLAPSEAVCVLRSLGGQTKPNIYSLDDYRNMKYRRVKLQVGHDPERREIVVSTDGFARMVKIKLDMDRLVMEDNFFDMLPGETRTICIRQAEDKGIPWHTLTVSAMNGI